MKVKTPWIKKDSIKGTTYFRLGTVKSVERYVKFITGRDDFSLYRLKNDKLLFVIGKHQARKSTCEVIANKSRYWTRIYLLEESDFDELFNMMGRLNP